jgi:hypothetical protein
MRPNVPQQEFHRAQECPIARSQASADRLHLRRAARLQNVGAIRGDLRAM